MVAQREYYLAIMWQDGGQSIVDIKDVVSQLPYFASLKDEGAFQNVSVVDYGTGIEWSNGIDYSADSLEVMATEQASLLQA